MVGFGQQTCLPVGPRCSECLNKSICPFGKSHKSPKKSPKKEIKKEEPSWDWEDLCCIIFVYK